MLSSGRGIGVGAIILVAAFGLPPAAADVELTAPVAELRVETGAAADCVPTERVCLVEYDAAERPEDATLNANSDIGLHLLLLGPGPVGSRDVLHVSGGDVALPLPILGAIRALHEAGYLSPMPGLVTITADDRHLVYEGPEAHLNESNPQPEVVVKHRSRSRFDADTFLFSTHSGNVTLHPGRMLPTQSSDEMLMGTGEWGCDVPEGGAHSVVCEPARVVGIVGPVIAAATPRIVVGASFTNATASTEASRSGNSDPWDWAAEGENFRRRISSPPVPFAPSSPTEAESGPARHPSSFAVPESPISLPRAPGSSKDPVSVDLKERGDHARPVHLFATSAALASVLAFALALLFRGRVRREGAARLLEDETRRRLLTVVRERPGLTVADLARASGLAHTPALYHVRLLTEAGLVVVARRGGPRSFLHVYAPSDAPPRSEGAREAALVLRAPAARAVARAVLAAGGAGAGVADVARAAGIPETTARFHLRRLREVPGLLSTARGTGGGLRFAAAPGARGRLEAALAGAPARPSPPT